MTRTLKKFSLTTPEKLDWLGKTLGTDQADGGTLKASLFIGTFPTGIIPSGVVVGKVTASGLYGPYDNAATDGRQVAAGHILTTKDLEVSAALPGGHDVSFALLWIGEVIESKLPLNHGLDAAGKVDLARIRYV